MLRSGYVLSYDMVAVPRQSLLPEFFGFGAGLPRAVPQDAVFALVTQVVAGEWLQKLMLLAILLLAGIGVGRLLSGFGRPWQLMGVTLAIWNPFVAERLVIGHWSLLLAYSVLPWMLAALVKIRSTDRGYIGLIWLAATGSLVPQRRHSRNAIGYRATSVAGRPHAVSAPHADSPVHLAAQSALGAASIDASRLWYVCR